MEIPAIETEDSRAPQDYLQQCVTGEIPDDHGVETNVFEAPKGAKDGHIVLSSLANSTSTKTPPTRYKKQIDSDCESHKYKTVTLSFLRLLSCHEFQLTSNICVSDNLVMKYRQKASDVSTTYHVQLKLNMGKDTVISKTEFLDISGDLSLVKHCASFLSLKLSAGQSDKEIFILYTDASVHGDLVDEIESDGLLSTGGKAVSFKPGGSVYEGLCEWVDFKNALIELNKDVVDTELKNRIHFTFDGSAYENEAVTSMKNQLLKTPTLAQLKELLKSLEPVRDKETYRSFLAKFQVYTNVSELDGKIKQELDNLWRCSHELSDKMFRELLGAVKSLCKKDGTSLTEDSLLWFDLVKSQTAYISFETVNILTSNDFEFEESSLLVLYDRIKVTEGILNVRVDSMTAASSLRVHRALSRFGSERLNALHVNVNALLAREDDVLSAWASRWCRVLVVECDTQLDTQQATRISEKILEVIGNETKLLVLIARKEHELNERLECFETYATFRDDGGWLDLTEATRENVNAETIVLNGVQTWATLSDLVGEDKEFFNDINLEVISQFISGDVSFGRVVDWGSEFFVKRRLRKWNCVDSFVVNSVLDVRDNVVLVVAGPGMGKSTLFTNLAKTAKTNDPKTWVVHIQLNKFVQYFENNKTFNASDFLQHVALHPGNYLECLLFKYFKHKVLIFVDGLDELSPRCERQVFTLLRFLKEIPSSQLWVSSRPRVPVNIERELNVNVHNLVGFSVENQNEFFSKALKEKLQADPHVLSATFGQDILQVPLECAVIAETFVNLQEFLRKKPLDRMGLFELFFVVKHEAYCAEKEKNLAGVHDSDKKHVNRWLDKLTLAALYVVFSTEDISGLHFLGNERFNEDLKELSNVIDKTGIIDNLPHFAHRSFAEYLAAMKLARCFEGNKKFLERILFTPAYDCLAEMFHRHLARGHPLHVAVFERDSTAIESLLTSETCYDVNEEDGGGRTPLHLAVIRCDTNCVEILLAKHKARPNVRDKVLSWVPLQYAEMSRAWDAFQVMLEMGVHKLDVHLDGWRKPEPCVMLDAARDAPLRVFRYLVEERGAELDCRGPDGETLVHKAAERDSVEILEYLSSKKLTLDTMDFTGNTALHSASQHCVDYLLANGLLLEAVNREGLTALQLSALRGEYGKMATLLDANASYQPKSPKITNKQLKSSLLCAAFAGNLSSVKSFLRNGAWKYYQDKNGHTVAWFAMHRGHSEIVDWLLLHESQPGDSTLHVACCTCDRDLVSFILSRGADVNSRGHGGQTPLMVAAEKGDLTIATRLLEKGANVECCDLNGLTAIRIALLQDNEEIAALLLSHGTDINAPNEAGETMLHQAALRDSLAMATLLLDHGANVECRDVEGNTTLHIASRWGSEQVAVLLLDRGADVNAANHEGETMLHGAARDDNLAVVTLLLEKGADVTCRDREGNTALHVACRWGNESVAAVLIRRGCDVNAVNGRSETMLHRACWSNGLAVVSLLLEKGVNVDCRDLEGMSPLHNASGMGFVEIVDLLLSHGACVDGVNKKGETALDLAIQGECFNVVKLLKVAGASVM